MNVKEIMSTRLVTVEMDDTLKVVKVIFANVNIHHLLVVGDDKLFGVISDAIEIFNNHDISCIPVVDDENRPVGIISWRDIIKAIKL